VRDLDAVATFADHTCGPVVSRWRRALNLSNEDRAALVGTLALLPGARDWPALGIAARKRLLARPCWPAALRLLRALDAADHVARLEEEAAPLIAEGVAPPPLVTGDDIAARGVPPGPIYKAVLDELYTRQLDEQLATRAEGLGALDALLRERGVLS
jgi:poly(A) polymerase